jgi:hypothetical protein
MTIKITKAGQSCTQCGTPVSVRHPEKPASARTFFFDWHLQCPNQKCRKMFLVEDVRRTDTPHPDLVVFDIDKPELVFDIDRVEMSGPRPI